MEAFTISDLRARAADLVRSADEGKLAVITKQGKPILVAVPFDETLLREGIHGALAIKLFDEECVSLGRAARLAGLSVSEMVNLLSKYGIPVIRTTQEALERELASFD